MALSDDLDLAERVLLVEIIDKHIAFVDANRRNVVSGAMNNIKKRADYEKKLSKLRVLRSKVSINV